MFTVVWLFIFSLCSAQSSGKIGNVTVKNYLKESVLSILCFIIQGKGSSGKGLILKFILLRMVINFDTIGFLVFTHAMNRSKYVVCFNKSFAGKVFMKFSGLCEFIMLCKFAMWVEM